MGPFVRQRYAIYTRQSSAGEAKVLSSCDAQFEICREFMSCYGSYVEWIGERLDDVEFTGADTNRPAFQRLTELVRKRQIQKLVIYRLDRLTRSLRDGAAFLEELLQNKVELIIVTAPELGAAASDRLVLNLMASFAEFEREMIGSRIAESRAYLRQHGRRLAGRLPYGYDADAKTKQLVINGNEARHVEAIFQMAAEGIAPSQIAAVANERGWKTKVTVAKRSGQKSGGGFWTPRQILDLLNNPVYLGVFADGEATRPGTHQPIISTDEFDAAGKQILKRHTTKAIRGSAKIPWPLRGKILCPECGRKLSPHCNRKGIFIYRNYRCRSHSGGRPPCKGVSLNAYAIESAVIKMVANAAKHQSNPALPNSEFFIGWRDLDEAAQGALLPELVIQVDFHKTKLRVEFDDGALIRLERDGRMRAKLG